MDIKDKTILITQDEDESEKLIELLEQDGAEFILCPLEKYVSVENDQIQETLNNIDQFDNILYGNQRNAEFFFDHIYEESILEKVLNRINFALDQQTANYLEERGVPAITAAPNTEPIDLVELMLRLGQMGKSLYPCGKHFKEELPGFLFELSIECKELELYDKVGPSEQDLKRYRVVVNESQPDIVVFHNEDSIRRIKIAFPDLKWDLIDKIAINNKIANKIKENGVNVDHVISFEEAEGIK